MGETILPGKDFTFGCYIQALIKVSVLVDVTVQNSTGKLRTCVIHFQRPELEILQGFDKFKGIFLTLR